MVESLLFRVTTILAVATGSAGLALSVLAWHRFRGSPFGRVLTILPVFMLSFTVYHAMLLAFPSAGEAVYVEISAFFLLVIFAAEMVRLHNRMSRRPGGDSA